MYLALHSPATPHFSGLCEAGIKSTKFHLKYVIGNQVFVYEEMQTLITRIEGILDSQSLIPSSSDQYNLCTSGHFLIVCPIVSLPKPNVLYIPDRWKRIR